MSMEFILKKNIFGGFDRRQVIDCISELQSKSVSSDHRNQIEVTKSRINEIKKKISVKDVEIDKLNKQLKELTALADMSTDDYSEAYASINEADKIISAAKNEANQYMSETDTYIKKSNKDFESLMNKVHALNNELKVMGKNADHISAELNKVTIQPVDKETGNHNSKPQIPDRVSPKYIPSPNDSISNDEYDDELTEEYDEITLPVEDTPTDDIPNSFNSIDNFFAELDKLTDIPKNID